MLATHSYGQLANARYRAAKARQGKQIEPDWIERTLGDRFFVDSLDVPRLLVTGTVRLPEEIEADMELDAQAAELEAERIEVERERAERTEKELAACLPRCPKNGV